MRNLSAMLEISSGVATREISYWQQHQDFKHCTYFMVCGAALRIKFQVKKIWGRDGPPGLFLLHTTTTNKLLRAY